MDPICRAGEASLFCSEGEAGGRRMGPVRRKQSSRYAHLAYRRKVACLGANGRSQASVFTMGELDRLLRTESMDYIRAEQDRRRESIWTPAQEGEYWSLKGELGL